jgi:hypothetical protein
MQEYNAMKTAGATEAELLHQKQLVDRAILAAAKSQKTVGTAGKALSAVDGVLISPFKTAPSASSATPPFFILNHSISFRLKVCPELRCSVSALLRGQQNSFGITLRKIRRSGEPRRSW